MSTMLIQIDELNDHGTGYPITLRDFNAETRQLGDIIVSDEIRTPLPPAGEGRQDAIEWIKSVLRDRERSPDTLAQIAIYLHNILRANQVGQKWFGLCEENDRGSEVRMRTYLDIRPEELQRLPWELIPYRTDRPDLPAQVFRSRGHRVMRGRPDMDGGIEERADPLPIRVLVVVCDHSADLRAEDEVDAIYAGLSRQAGIWQVEVLREPDWDTLRETLKSFLPHIFHVISHTTEVSPLAFKVRQCDPVTGHLLTPWYLRVSDIDDLLIEYGSVPLLFVLNACHTAEMVPAERFRTLGMKGVVATQSEINSAEAVKFTEAFYGELAQTGSIEDAMWHARNEMRHRRHQDHHDWGIPVLTVFGSSKDVIRRDLPNLGQCANRLRSNRYAQTQLLVDRTVNHRMIWGQTDGKDNNLCPDRHLVVISGRPNSGKTQLIYSCMLTWELRGSRGIIIDMAHLPESILPSYRYVTSAREALMHICGSLSVGLEFAGTNVPAVSSLRNVGNRLQKHDPRVMDDDEEYRNACAQILDILATELDGRPLLIVLDQLEKIVAHHLHGIISDKLLWPIACNRLDDVYVIAAVGEEALLNGRLGSVPQEWEWPARVSQIEIDFFQPKQAMSLGREYGARKGWVAATEWQSWISGNRRMQDAAWPPVELLRLAAAYEKYGRRP